MTVVSTMTRSTLAALMTVPLCGGLNGGHEQGLHAFLTDALSPARQARSPGWLFI
jgi:hypothetical protein